MTGPETVPFTKSHEIDPKALPDAIIPDYLAPSDIASFVKRAVAQCQVMQGFNRAAEEAGNDGGVPALAGAIARQGVDNAIIALNLLAPPINPTESSWFSTIYDLAEQATLEGLDFAGEVRL